MNYWIYLLLASIFETTWTLSMKHLDGFEGWTLKAGIWPFLAVIFEKRYVLFSYVASGILNVIFLSKAVKGIAMSTALPIWMGVSLVLIAMVDFIIYKEPFSVSKIFFIAIIIAGVIGLRVTHGE